MGGEPGQGVICGFVDGAAQIRKVRMQAQGGLFDAAVCFFGGIACGRRIDQRLIFTADIQVAHHRRERFGHDGECFGR
ncbi:hypothetical protein D3C76_1488050 [compost metagenome]